MTQATHTPGPWVASLAEGHNGAPWLIGAPVSDCLPAEAERHIGNAYKEANARLIAAAPELLAAVKALLPWVAKGIADEAFSGCALPRAAQVALYRAHAAIAKATERNSI